MTKKEIYKHENEQFLKKMANEAGVSALAGGVLYKVLEKGEGDKMPDADSIVTVHYKGTLINGREFDNSWNNAFPEAFRLRDLIEGWQIALKAMHVGDRWMIYIPQELGYGKKLSGDIPGNSTLVFDVQLLGVA